MNSSCRLALLCSLLPCLHYALPKDVSLCPGEQGCQWTNLGQNTAAAPKLDLAERYLYTMRITLIGLAQAIPNVRTGKFEYKKRINGHDWPTFGASAAGLVRMDSLHDLLRNVFIVKKLHGDFLETGVWRGGSCLYAKAFIEAYGIKKHVWGLDSFSGLPTGQHPRDPHHNFQSFLVASQESVEDLFKRYELWDDKVHLVKGWFEDTLPVVRKQVASLSILRLDGDLYKSTLEVLCALYDHLLVGGFWIMDDYGMIHARSAAHNFIRVPVDNSGAGQNYMPGMYTDDLEMTLGLAHALMQKENPTADDMLAFWKDEYFRGQEHYLHTRFWALAGIGRNGHGGIASVYSGSCTIENMRSRISGMRYPGNAPPMRALPLAFVADDARLTELARRNADATHPHIKARAASLGIAIVGRYVVIERGALDGLIPHLTRRLAELNEADPSKSMVDEETLTYLREVDELPGPGPLDSTYESFMSEATLVKLCGTQPIWRGPDGNPPDHNPRLVQILNADAQRTLGCVAYLLRHHREGQAMETVLRSLYIGGDVDSSAALCLAMVGGREGLRVGQPGGVPPFLLQHLEAAEYVAETAKAFEAWVAKM
eukprot:TRINITY_DN11825_c0_g1_i1.p1 TRINITY_DN11825_c0_g1~~TRINITY_DN11825_c0_g1_i1.p1  ORF type:complete len:606 (-),score=66.17 TRINITY_DN11825_c0_g1_i1:268-2064(-)